MKNFLLNLIIYVVGLKYLISKYNLIGKTDEYNQKYVKSLNQNIT